VLLAGGGFAWFWLRRGRKSSSDEQSSVGEVSFVADRIEGMEDATLVTYAETMTYEGASTGAPSGMPSTGGLQFTVNPAEGLYLV
jgi:hypothetical protein